MATEAEPYLAKFLSYNLVSAQNSYSSHKGWIRGNTLSAVQSRTHDVRTLRTPTSATERHEAIDKYTKKCEEICIERLMVIEAVNMGDHTKEIDNMTIKRARQEVTDVYSLHPWKQHQSV